MGNEHSALKLLERVRVVKVDLDHPEKAPEIIEQETLTEISRDEAALLGFTPGQGFIQEQSVEREGSSVCEGSTIGDQ